MIALIGIPNSGKSTLLNRLTGQNVAVTANEAHTTRDVNYGEDYWDGYYLRFVDTGGLVPDPSDEIQKLTQMKSWAAIAESDILIWVIDKRQNPETVSDEFLQKMWKLGKPVILVINKVDSPSQEKDIAEYARFGTDGFLNVSAVNGYNLSELMDEVIAQLQQLGFQPNAQTEEIPRYFTEKISSTKKEKKSLLTVKKSGDHYYVVRENSSGGPGLFESVDVRDNMDQISSWEEDKLLNISTIIFDLHGVVFQPNSFVPQPGIAAILHELRRQGKKLLYATNASKEAMQDAWNTSVMKYFHGGLASWESEFAKPQSEFWQELCDFFEASPSSTLVFDDAEENVESALQFGMWAEMVSDMDFVEDGTATDNSEASADLPLQNDVSTELSTQPTVDDQPLLQHLKSIEVGETPRVKTPTKVLLLGKPNVGKSSIFNHLVGKDMQIVTDIAGTTLSVNDELVRNTITEQEYILLDSAGIRKKGKRTTGAETFATYRTIQAAYEADVICLVLDASQPISHQDQVVAGIAEESYKGLVVLANKFDLLDEESKARFLKEIRFKLNFLKVEDFVWISAQTGENMAKILPKIDQVAAKRQLSITRVELRKLFNYLMKQKPPAKLPTKKRAVIYDLIFTKQNPPTFELLIKDKTSVHWSYVRFLKNMIRKQFNLSASGLVVKLTEVDRGKVLQ